MFKIGIVVITIALLCAQEALASGRHYPIDNDEEYVPFILRDEPTSPPVENRHVYPGDNDAEYQPVRPYNYEEDQYPPAQEYNPETRQYPVPYDNDEEYEAPRPKGTDGDMYIYPLYY